MSVQNDGMFGTYRSGAAIGPFLLVTIDASKQLVVNGAGVSLFHGVTQKRSTAANQNQTIKYKKSPGTFRCVAAEAIAAGAVIYAAAAGKVKDTADGTAIGIAMEAASGDGAEIECLLNQ